MTFEIKMGSKDISVPGSLKMRKDEVIRLQLFIPILGTEVGRLEFTPDYVLIVDRLHKEYIKQTIARWIFSGNKASRSILFKPCSGINCSCPAYKSKGIGSQTI